MASIAQLQKRSTAAAKKSTIAIDAEEFKERNREKWQESSNVKECKLCADKFTLTNRKHHCRECGDVFCGKCTSHQVVISGSLKRSCAECYKKLVHKDDLPSNDSGIIKKPSNNTTSNEFTLKKKTTDYSSSYDNQTVKLPKWAEAFIFVKKLGNEKEFSVQSVYPEGNLSQSLIDDISEAAIPKPVSAKSKYESHFLYRVREKSSNSTAFTAPGTVVKDPVDDEIVGTAVTKTTIFYNCYVFHRQHAAIQTSTDANNISESLVRQSIILVSKWAFPQLAFQLLSKLDEAFLWQLNNSNSINSPNKNKLKGSFQDDEDVDQWNELNDKEFNKQSPNKKKLDSSKQIDNQSNHSTSTTNPNPNDSTSTLKHTSMSEKKSISDPINNVNSDTAKDVLMVAYGQIALWPPAEAGLNSLLHFLGETLQYNVSADTLSTYGVNVSFSSAFASINLVSLLGPLGLLQHIWTLWELMVTGQDIVVITSTPTQCSEIVLAIASLMLPFNSVGDFRPYLASTDSDTRVIAITSLEKSKKNYQNDLSNPRKKSLLVGISEVSLLNKLEAFDAAIFIAPLSYSKNNNDADAVFKGLRKKNAASFQQTSPLPRDNSLSPTKSSFLSRHKITSFTEYFNDWTESNSKKSVLVCRQDLSAQEDNKLIKKIRNINNLDRNVLGDKLIRDNLKDLTNAFFKPIIDSGVSLEDANARETAIIRAEIAHQVESIAKLEETTKNSRIFILQLMSVDEFKAWSLKNVPTVILWSSYIAIILYCWFISVPSILIIGFNFFK